MHLSDLQSKNIVNINDGKNIGNIIDIIIDNENGAISSLVLENKSNMLSFLNKENFIEVKWKNIKKIGEDVILVDLK